MYFILSDEIKYVLKKKIKRNYVIVTKLLLLTTLFETTLKQKTIASLLEYQKKIGWSFSRQKILRICLSNDNNKKH